MSSTYDSALSPTVEESGRATQVESVLGSEISILDLLQVVAKYRVLISRCVLGAIVLATIGVIFMPNYYTGESVILTPSKRPSISDALMGNFGGALGALSAADSLGLKDPNDVYIAMLKSRPIADRIIKKYDLLKYYDESKYADTLEDFANDSTISSGHDGTITVDYLHKDPKIAAAVSNAYIQELKDLTQRVEMTESAQRKEFYDKQLQNSRQLLSKAEDDLKKSQENSGMLDLDKQATAMVTAIATVQGQIMGQEIMIRGMKMYSTSRNPDVMVAEEQLASMKAQLSDLEKRGGTGDGDVMVGTGKIPSKGLEYMRNLRNVRYNEAVFEILGKQYEAATIDTGMSGDIIQIVADASPSDKKTKPKRSLIVLAAAFVAFVLAYMWAFSVEISHRISLDPVDGPKMRYIQEAMADSRAWIARKIGRGRLRFRSNV